jgi:SpoIID/LytB domain protein
MGEPILRVGLGSDQERARISLRGTYLLDGKPLPATEGLQASAAGELLLADAAGNAIARRPEVRLEPADADASFVFHGMTVGVQFHWQHQQDLQFRGALRLAAHGNVLDVIDEVGLETYLRSVISSEMSARCPPALLRAHAVISRSWLLAMLEGQTTRQRSATQPHRSADGVLELVKWYDREDHQHFDVCADDHCQRYQGISRTTTQEAVEAVEATRGLVLTWQGQVCDARFSKSCGGMTEIFSSAWGDLDPAYLAAVPDDAEPARFELPLTDERKAVAFIDASPPAFCNTTDRALLDRVLPELDHATTRFYRWEEVVTAAEVRQYVQEKVGVDVGVVTELRPLERGPSGRLTRLAIVGESDTLRVGKELEIRKLLSKTHLYSSAFTVRTEGEGEARKFVLRGAGWGHGVGLCQIGAAVMADRGYDHPAILSHYYPGAQLVKRY